MCETIHFVSQRTRLFNRTKPQWKPIYSAHRTFCDKGHSRQDAVRTDSNLDTLGSDQNHAGAQLLGEDSPTGEIDDNVGNVAEQPASVSNDNPTTTKNCVFRYLSSKRYDKIWFRETMKKATAAEWEYIKKVAQILVALGAALTIYNYYQRKQIKTQPQQSEKENKLNEVKCCWKFPAFSCV